MTGQPVAGVLRWLRRGRRLLALRVVAGIASATVGALVLLVTAAIGHCGSSGGTCPSPPGLRGDVYGGLAAGGILAFVVPVLAWRPSRRGVRLAVAIAALVVIPLTAALGTALVRGGA